MLVIGLVIAGHGQVAFFVVKLIAWNIEQSSDLVIGRVFGPNFGGDDGLFIHAAISLFVGAGLTWVAGAMAHIKHFLSGEKDPDFMDESPDGGVPQHQKIA